MALPTKVRHMEELCKLVEEVVARLQAERKARGGESGYDSEPGYDDARVLTLSLHLTPNPDSNPNPD